MFGDKLRHRRSDRESRREGHDDVLPEDRRGRGSLRARRLGRLFEHGDLRVVILHLIAGKPRHGYEIIKAIEDMAGGAYSPSPGAIYPALTLLEDQGYASVAPGEGTKRLYAVTEAGEAYLTVNRPALDALLARAARLGAMQQSRFSPQVLRATENLRTALRLRLSSGPLSEEQTRAVAEILDRAANEIERT